MHAVDVVAQLDACSFERRLRRPSAGRIECGVANRGDGTPCRRMEGGWSEGESACTPYTGPTLDEHRRTAGGSSVGWIHLECGDPDRGTPYRWSEGKLGEAR